MSQTLCYYCGKHHADARYVFRKSIYKKVDSNYGIGLTGLKKTTRYQEKEFTINRCTSCYDEHHKSRKPTLLIFLVTLVLSGIITWFFAKRVFVTLVVAIVAAIIAIVLYTMLVYRKRLKALGIKDENETDEYLPIKMMLEDGWQTYKPS